MRIFLGMGTGPILINCERCSTKLGEAQTEIASETIRQNFKITEFRCSDNRMRDGRECGKLLLTLEKPMILCQRCQKIVAKEFKADLCDECRKDNDADNSKFEGDFHG